MQLFASAVAALIFAGLAAVDPSASPSTSPSPSPSASPVVVHIRNFAYSPQSVKIIAGQSVTFVNDDDMAHTVSADDHSYDSGDMQKGAKWTHAFTKVGTSTYICAYHTFMKGSVVIEASSK